MRRFLADASHELRTPVAAVQASAETLLRGQPSRPEHDEIEARLARDAARLGGLIDDLLGLARLEAHVGAPDGSVDLSELARAATTEAWEREPRAQITLEACDDARVRGDRDGLSRVLRNLIDIALMAVVPDGRVEVAIRRTDSHVEVRVADDGPGIPEKERERIFQRFVRLDPSRAEGTGLGLAIARRIALQHGGELMCDDIPKGELHIAIAPEACRFGHR